MKNKRIIFVNGLFHTLQRGTDGAQAVAVDNGVITEIGSNRDIRPLTRRGFETVDLKNRVVLPGIIDAHVHLLPIGNLFKRVDLDGIESLEKVAAVLREAVSKLGKGQWMLGRGWNKNLWGNDFPDKSILDSVTQNPVALFSKDGHLLWVNSAAMESCGIDRHTPDPPGGSIAKDAGGDPTGILKENAVDMVTEKIPRQSRREKLELIVAAQKHLLRMGIVAVGDCDTEPSRLSELHELESEGRLHLRVFKMIHPNDLEAAIRLGLRTGFGSAHVRMGGIKLYADGALGSQTAYMFKPYEGSEDNRGIATLTQDQMESLVSDAANAGISVAVHAIGDRANYEALTAIGRCSALLSKQGLRPRIEHAQLLRKEEISLFKRHGVIASVQPIHATSDRDVADRYWGTRARYAYSFRSLLGAGARLAFGSDAPIETPNPMAGLHAAVTRRRADEDRKAWYPGERLTVQQALRAYTIGSAYACHMDDIIGSLSVGKRADLAVVSDDPFRVRPGDIHGIEVLATIVDGRIVHGSRSLLR
jgi:predicted amidohydrolase YtcJ